MTNRANEADLRAIDSNSHAGAYVNTATGQVIHHACIDFIEEKNTATMLEHGAAAWSVGLWARFDASNGDAMAEAIRQNIAHTNRNWVRLTN